MDEVSVATHQNSGHTFALLQQCRRLGPSYVSLSRLWLFVAPWYDDTMLMLSFITLARQRWPCRDDNGVVPSSASAFSLLTEAFWLDLSLL